MPPKKKNAEQAKVGNEFSMTPREGTAVRRAEWMPQPHAEMLKPILGHALISITSPELGRADLHPRWVDLLRIEFDDIEEEADNLMLFDATMADAIIDFLDRLESRVERVIVHCYAGISRSAAVARFVAFRYDIPGHKFDYDYVAYNEHVFRTLVHRDLRRGQKRKK